MNINSMRRTLIVTKIKFKKRSLRRKRALKLDQAVPELWYSRN